MAGPEKSGRDVHAQAHQRKSLFLRAQVKGPEQHGEEYSDQQLNVNRLEGGMRAAVHR